jgi:hypothetical protein
VGGKVMGTNHYIKLPCTETLHIGKSSAGWCFALHVYPERGITNLEDWLDLLYGSFSGIEDEYGRWVTPAEMLEQITFRDWAGTYTHSPEFHMQNCSESGPNGLLRCKVDGVHCIGHGEGTYDYIVGDFS